LLRGGVEHDGRMCWSSSPSIADKPPLLTAADVGTLLGVDERTVRRNSHAGKLPRPVRVTARCIRWRRDELWAWLQAGCPDRKRWEAMRDG
jgi:predicted DNA-binding transcriptional regulator AlpA